MPIFVAGINLIDTIFEVGVRGDSSLAPRLVVEGIFLLIFIFGYLNLLKEPAPSQSTK